MTEDLQYRLYNLSMDPPANAWPGIALQLDQESAQKLSLKLHEAALEPPPAVWESIASALQETTTAKVIPIRRPWTRIAVAAIAIGIIVLAGLFYFMQTETPAGTAGTAKKAPSPSITHTRPQKEDIRIEVPQPQAALNFAAAGTTVPVRVNSSPRIRYARVETPSPQQEELNTDVIVQDQVAIQPNTYIAPRQYFTIAAPNGTPVKISAKFSDGLGYLYNFHPVFSMDGALRSISWKAKFSKWSNKLISNTGFIPAASNFFDIVELEELLKEQ